MPDSSGNPAAPAPAPAAELEVPTRSRRRVFLTRAAIALAVFVLVWVAVDYGTASPALCGACHGMSSRAGSWAQSSHSEVACVSCHQPPTKWYQLPQRLVARARLLGRDARWELAGSPTETGSESTSTVSSVSSENCLQCHSPDRKSTSGFRILIDHPEHAKRNGSCLTCHSKTAHPDPTRGKAISLMDQCFNCHGTAAQPTASADCRLCHPSDYKLLPASHKPAKWEQSVHAKIAKADRDQCALCHKPQFCTDCHGVEMPHPAGWAEGSPAGHAVAAEQSRETCARCHKEKPDLCSMCHHKGWEPDKGPWLQQHKLMVDQRGAAFCVECHKATFCADCHIARGDTAPIPVSTQ